MPNIVIEPWQTYLTIELSFSFFYFFWLDADARLVLTDVQDNAYKSLCSHNLVIMLCECIAQCRVLFVESAPKPAADVINN